MIINTNYFCVAGRVATVFPEPNPSAGQPRLQITIEVVKTWGDKEYITKLSGSKFFADTDALAITASAITKGSNVALVGSIRSSEKEHNGNVYFNHYLSIQNILPLPNGSATASTNNGEATATVAIVPPAPASNSSKDYSNDIPF